MSIFTYFKTYSLAKSKRILKQSYALYQKGGGKLPGHLLDRFEKLMASLDEKILAKETTSASNLAKELESFSKDHLTGPDFSSSSDTIKSFVETIFALSVAIAVAICIRQMWFENYEIPTGSMRPTFREQDHLIVTKTQFGLNVPLTSRHFFFDEENVKRAGPFTFSAEAMPIHDAETVCFGVFPCTKRLIKRMIGLPGDTLYFYGGKIYGIDRNGHPIEELLDSPYMAGLEHIPFMNIEGDVSFTGQGYSFKLNQNEIGRLKAGVGKDLLAEVYDGKKWVKDNPIAQKSPHTTIETYSDFYGIRNFATARLLTKDEVKSAADLDLKNGDEGVLYLELRHTPSLSFPYPGVIREPHFKTVILNPYRTVIALDQAHLDRLMDSMYTARLVFKNGRAQRYSLEERPCDASCPSFPNVPDGTYEFYHGKLFEVKWGGTLFEAPKDHPLYSRSKENIQKLFNLGIEMNNAYKPLHPNQLYYPNRYAYFREGDLYALGKPLFFKDEPTLQQFLKSELEKEKSAPTSKPYIAFKDYGPPLKDGQLDKDFLRTFGLKVPEKKYYGLGDNHAMSGDSRSFGFIPESNVQGRPLFIFWPFGNRFGLPEQPSYPFFTSPALVVWAIAAIIALIAWLIHKHKLKKPTFIKISFRN